MFRLNAATGTLFTRLSTYYHLDSPCSITNTAGKEVWRWDNTDPFGNNIANENPANQGPFTFNLRFPGQYFDRETGLHYNVNRDYNPATGRYVESDPIGLRGGINTFGYVKGNPLRWIDLLGLFNSIDYANWMNDHAHAAPTGYCAKYVRRGLEAGGADTAGHPVAAKDL